MDRYERLGLGGAFAGADGVHVAWHACPYEWKPLCKGKEMFPTVMFNVISGSTTEIYDIYGGDWGARNDKTAARLHTFIRQLRDKDPAVALFTNAETKLYGDNGQKDVVLKGAHIVVDGGFHPWGCLLAPKPSLHDVWLARLSEQLESARKPSSECGFGRMQRRFRILRAASMSTTRKSLGMFSGFVQGCII